MPRLGIESAIDGNSRARGLVTYIACARVRDAAWVQRRMCSANTSPRAGDAWPRDDDGGRKWGAVVSWSPGAAGDSWGDCDDEGRGPVEDFVSARSRSFDGWVSSLVSRCTLPFQNFQKVWGKRTSVTSWHTWKHSLPSTISQGWGKFKPMIADERSFFFGSIRSSGCHYVSVCVCLA